mmetsp:Transcript_27590/g.33506  ORF Transcript_27590/g.33506 Transcript_27590/m.33506 type:complete len:527 (-) Transcript_27590:100-1680(-)|eukprot:CAMPEP_0172495526 /NCGR_PEP_ID=MMETSP1066-20121228/71449_1 /TAXON_ID=671091 /ORGANISM="Coscinodiscus wailesii, Strain CCMP2513" /LENGTH=526 /DNA_ID=CAMNT_0013267263 /DNA_START=128 /DNA_END=1708 /DNA_ORIENTATION=-
MTDPPTKDEKKSPAATKTSLPPIPPIDAASRRLERLLGGNSSTDGSTRKQQPVLQSHPTKTVRRWLGTSSGTAGKATLSDIASASIRLLDPAGPSSEGRAVLSCLAPVDDAPMEEEGGEEKKEREVKYLKIATREVEGWLISLAVRLLYRDSQYTASLELATRGTNILQSHIDSSRSFQKGWGDSSGLFPLLARMHRYKALVADRVAADSGGGIMPLRAEMVQAHRMACLRRDVDCQATLLNLMLGDLLKANQVEQAQKLVSNSTFPETASNNQLCRYLYNSGRIQALRLEYTSAFSNLSQSLRKCPTNTALGFRIAVQRLLVVVQLLMGEIPERSLFFQKGMRVELEPYLKITQAVRRGDLRVFHERVGEHASRLREDGTFTLISRLAHSVVKAGLRKLNLSYSRISLKDVADRLALASARSAEFVVAKAVRDGVIDATIDHEGGFVKSHELVDIYATTEPAEAFHRRIAYCLTTHNEAVRGMRYPPDAYKKQLEASRGGKRSGDDDKTDEEKAQELEDELDEEF